MNNKANATSFKPGVSGNPAGRSSEKRKREEDLAEVIGGLIGPDGAKAAKRLYEIAMKGEHKDSIAAIKVLFERWAGKAPEFLHVEGKVTPRPTVDVSKIGLDEAKLLLSCIERAAIAKGDGDADGDEEEA